jgi:hypothetical protein
LNGSEATIQVSSLFQVCSSPIQSPSVNCGIRDDQSEIALQDLKTLDGA